MSDMKGQTIAGYPIEKLLGKGSYSEAYQAATSAAPLAVKLLHPDLRQNAALNQAISKGWESARAVTHANLVSVFSTGIDPAHGAYCLEELVQGKSLRQMVLGGSKVAWRDCMIMAEQLFSALHALHSNNKCHGDIWPSNVLITQDQDLKLEGAGGLSAPAVWHTEIFIGAAIGYLAPETVRGSPINSACDLYAAGACLYFCLAGQDAFPGERLELVSKAVLERKPSPLSVLREDLPPEAEEFIARLLAKDPTQRYGEVTDVLADLKQLKSGGGLAPLKGGKTAPPPRIKAPPASARFSNNNLPPVARFSNSNLPPVARYSNSNLPPVARYSNSNMAAVRGESGSDGSPLTPYKPLRGSASNSGLPKVFGRLETHVKSTIPQSDTEKRGDDLYRQGQLPLAVGAWKEAFENGTPHAALKAKIELADRELKKEVYNADMEEAKERAKTGDYRRAIARANEAMLSAENEHQRQDAVNLESEIISQMTEAEKKSKIKMAALGAGVFVFVIIIIFLMRGSPKEPEITPVVSPPPKALGAGSVKTAVPQNTILNIPGANATIIQPAEWHPMNTGRALAELHAIDPNQPAAILKITKYPSGSLRETLFKSMQTQSGLKNANKLEEIENLKFIDGHFQCSELGFNYIMDDGKQGTRYYFFIPGPGDALYGAEADGQDAVFTPALREQMRDMIRSWTYMR